MRRQKFGSFASRSISLWVWACKCGKCALAFIVRFFFCMKQPGSLRPLRTVRASFPAHGSGTFKACPVREDPAVITTFVVVDNKSSNLSAFFG